LSPQFGIVCCQPAIASGARPTPDTRSVAIVVVAAVAPVLVEPSGLTRLRFRIGVVTIVVVGRIARDGLAELYARVRVAEAVVVRVPVINRRLRTVSGIHAGRRTAVRRTTRASGVD
jgi:hypothetical protein